MADIANWDEIVKNRLDILPSLIHGTTNIQSTLKPGQKIKVEGRVGTIKQVGTLHIILENDKGETLVLPTKMIADKEIIVESGPPPEIPEKKIEKMTLDNESKQIDHESKQKSSNKSKRMHEFPISFKLDWS